MARLLEANNIFYRIQVPLKRYVRHIMVCGQHDRSKCTGDKWTEPNAPSVRLERPSPIPTGLSNQSFVNRAQNVNNEHCLLLTCTIRNNVVYNA